MRWLGTLIADLIIRSAHWTPYHHLDGYMERWWFFGGSHPDSDDRSVKERGWRGNALDRFVGRFVRARVHHILRSDNDRHLHDHRWPSLSIVLRGGYWEVMPFEQAQDPAFDSLLCQRRWRGPGSVIFRPSATSRHVLQLPSGRTCWTLFFMFGKPQDWGFYTHEGKILAQHYDAWKAKQAQLQLGVAA